MGKHWLSSKKPAVEFHDNNIDSKPNPGCMGGILQIFHYRGSRYKRKNILYLHGNRTEDTQFGHGEVELEAESRLVMQHHQQVSATSKSPTRSQNRGIDTENKSKERNGNGWFISHHAEARHVESSVKSVHYEACETMDHTHNIKEANKLNKHISSKSMDHTDVHEVFRVEKDLILKFLRDVDVGKESWQQTSNNKATLMKSGTFPSPAYSPMTRTCPTSNQIWAFPKGEKLLAGTQAPKLFASSSAKDLSYMKPVPSASNTNQSKKGFSSTRPSNHKSWNQLVIHRFKIIKQKIKLALVEFAKSGAHQAPVEAIHQRASSELSRLPCSRKRVSQNLEDHVTEKYTEKRISNETKASDYDSSKCELHPMRRTSSLNESLDRYTRLLEQSFCNDIRWHGSKSRSLRPTNEDKIHAGGAAPRLSKRNLSLPNLESLGFILHESLCYPNDTGLPGTTSADDKTNAEPDFSVFQKSVSLKAIKDKQLQPIMETDIQKVEVKLGEALTSHHREDIQEQVAGDQSFGQEKETSLKIYPDKDVISVLRTKCEDIAAKHAEGAETATQESSMEEPEVGLSNMGSTNSLPDPLCNTDDSAIEKGAEKGTEHTLLFFESARECDSNFQYVKNLLELSGFMGNEHIQTWHTVDMPLKPSLFKDLEASLLQETKCSGQEITCPVDHQLLFELVNEVLLEIRERSPTYFPKSFSFNSSLHSMPKGHRLLNEVWTKVNSYLNLKPELDQTLDDVVNRDLAKTLGWMNLQWEEEFVALELEEMIVANLLNEII